MASQWSHLKSQAIQFRKSGWSIKQVESKLKIPRSTLSGWFKKVVLTLRQKRDLLKRWKNGLVLARGKAVLWHNHEKQKRLLRAEQEAQEVINRIDVHNPDVLDLALAMLYVGEGNKKSPKTALGNSDPEILKFFLLSLKTNYGVDFRRIRCDLYLRADQNEQRIKKFWSQALNLPMENFKYTHKDQRTISKKTFSDYKGVCTIGLGEVAIQRKLLNISKEFFRKLMTKRP